jgi:hypothetical protein
LLYDYTNSDFFGGNKRRITISLPFHQAEGIATNNGLKFYISNENFVKSPFINNPQKLHILDLSPFLDKYLESIKVSIPETELKKNFSLISPNPASDLIRVNSALLPTNFILTNLLGEIISRGELTPENPVIYLSGLSPGMYMLSIGFDQKIISKLYKQ